jgi:hypothetical protein
MAFEQHAKHEPHIMLDDGVLAARFVRLGDCLGDLQLLVDAFRQIDHRRSKHLSGALHSVPSPSCVLRASCDTACRERQHRVDQLAGVQMIPVYIAVVFNLVEMPACEFGDARFDREPPDHLNRQFRNPALDVTHGVGDVVGARSLQRELLIEDAPCLEEIFVAQGPRALIQ